MSLHADTAAMHPVFDMPPAPVVTRYETRRARWHRRLHAPSRFVVDVARHVQNGLPRVFETIGAVAIAFVTLLALQPAYAALIWLGAHITTQLLLITGSALTLTGLERTITGLRKDRYSAVLTGALLTGPGLLFLIGATR